MTEPRYTPPRNGPDQAAGSVPPGFEEWAASLGAGSQPPRGLPDLSAVYAIFESLRRLIPVELHEQVNALQREILLTLRALIDWYLERLDGQSRAPQVEEIPIE